MTPEENLASLIKANALLAARERRRASQFIAAMTLNLAELDHLAKDYEDEKQGDWTR